MITIPPFLRPLRLLRLLRRTALLVLALSLTQSAAAFGAKGHRLIAALTEDHLAPSAHAAIVALLDPDESLGDASVWMDQMRDDPHPFWSYDYAANWHFANVDPGQDYASSRKSPRGDAVMALEAAIAVLEGGRVPPGPVREGLSAYLGNLEASVNQPALRQLALRFVLHLAGDLHQPLHLGYEADRGGNDIEVHWFGRRSNLHRVWDSQLLDYADLSLPQFAERLRSRIEALPAARREALMQEPPQQWLRESLALRGTVYDLDSSRLGARYARTHLPLLEEQISKAALRLAGLLNRLFAGADPRDSHQ